MKNCSFKYQVNITRVKFITEHREDSAKGSIVLNSKTVMSAAELNELNCQFHQEIYSYGKMRIHHYFCSFLSFLTSLFMFSI